MYDLLNHEEKNKLGAKHSENLWSFFESALDGMALVREEGPFILFNPAFAKILGYDYDELAGMNAEDLYVDTGHRSLMRERMDDEGAIKDHEALLRKKDGSIISCLITSKRVKTADGRVVYQKILRDVTEQKIAQDKLEDALDLNEKILLSSPFGIATYGPDGQCLSANESSASLIGTNLENVLSQNFRKLRSWRDSGLLEAAERTLRDGVPTRTETHLFTSFGKEVWLDCRFTRFFSDASAHLLLCFADITDLKLAQQESSALFRSCFELSHIGMAVMSADQEMVMFNDQLCGVFGYGREEFGSKNWADLTHPEDRDADLLQLQEMMKGKIDAYSMEKRFVDKSGEIVDVSLHVSCARRKTGEVQNLIYHVQDITRRKRNERELLERTEQLEAVNNELKHFAYVASHDLREPLRKISSFVELLAKRYRGQLDDRADKYIDYVVDGANRMQRLIDDLLSFSRISGAELIVSPVNLRSIVETTIKDLEKNIDETDAKIIYDSLPVVHANPTQMAQLFQNLIFNALKFRSKAAPSVHISAKLQNDHWLISVRDNGVGFDMEDAERIFGVFQRLHSREDYEGTGIGLAVCKKIVERHGGAIWAESQPDMGSTFHFSIPDR